MARFYKAITILNLNINAYEKKLISRSNRNKKQLSSMELIIAHWLINISLNHQVFFIYLYRIMA
jgi:hypothetical protein